MGRFFRKFSEPWLLIPLTMELDWKRLFFSVTDPHQSPLNLFLTTKSAAITGFFSFLSPSSSLPVIGQSRSCEAAIKQKVSVTFKGAVSPRSHSWTHALPCADITRRLLPWAPVLPSDKCRHLSLARGLWTGWQPRLTAACSETPAKQPTAPPHVFHASIDREPFNAVYVYSWRAF